MTTFVGDIPPVCKDCGETMHIHLLNLGEWTCRCVQRKCRHQFKETGLDYYVCTICGAILDLNYVGYF